MRATRRRNAATFRLSELVDCCGCRSRLSKRSFGSPSNGRSAETDAVPLPRQSAERDGVVLPAAPSCAAWMMQGKWEQPTMTKDNNRKPSMDWTTHVPQELRGVFDEAHYACFLPKNWPGEGRAV